MNPYHPAVVRVGPAFYQPLSLQLGHQPRHRGRPDLLELRQARQGDRPAEDQDREGGALRRREPRGVVGGPEPAEQVDGRGVEAVRQLPGAQRAAIVLFYYEDRPVAEIAMILGCAEATARVHLHRGRKRMAQILGEADDVV